MTRKRKSTARHATESSSSRRQTPPPWPRHKALNRLGIMHAVWLMMLLPLPVSAQVIEFLPELSGSGVPVSLNIGNQGGNGTYNLSGGTLEFDGSVTTSFIVLGRNGASSSASA